jgi:hypothetical protein
MPPIFLRHCQTARASGKKTRSNGQPQVRVVVAGAAATWTSQDQGGRAIPLFSHRHLPQNSGKEKGQPTPVVKAVTHTKIGTCAGKRNNPAHPFRQPPPGLRG